MSKLFLLLLFFVLLNSALSGQKAPIKYGDVSLEELQMKSYPADTSAPAVILCDYGAFTSIPYRFDAFNPTYPFEFVRIRRIKILKKEGYSWANSGYPGSENTRIKGITFNLENGKIVKTNLKNESIFRDKITNDRYVIRIAMPDVKVGSVIELQFNSVSPVQVWKFQEDIPVKYSEIIMEDLPEVRFKNNFFGYEPLFLTSPNRWVAKEMPSFKEEPYLSSKENFVSKLEFDLLNVGFQTVATSWENISSLLIRDPYFGSGLTGSAFLNGLVQSIEDSKGTREEMLREAFESIKSIVKWNEQQSLFTSTQSLGFVYKMKIGNSADINLILLQLLTKLKFDASPVALSTRENGFLSLSSPSIQKLNYVVVLVKLGDKSFLLDATEQYIPYYLIPFRCLNYSGRLVDEKISSLITVGTTYKEKEFTTYQLKIHADNRLEGKLYIKCVDYSALNFRKKYHTFNSLEEYLDDFKKDKQGLLINEPKIENIDSLYLPALEDYSVTINDQVSEIGNELYILPMFYNQLMENPFRMDVRKYPVDYGYGIEKTITSVIEIPENYEVSELPATVKISLQDNDASLAYIAGKSGHTVSVKSVFSIKKTMFFA
ncbi:MAG: DUF3857 domain-containing protein [Bacteroidales bacterium]|nr:DUF3857 domain-containing protein [Bacteroidales bacterium]